MNYVNDFSLSVPLLLRLDGSGVRRWLLTVVMAGNIKKISSQVKVKSLSPDSGRLERDVGTRTIPVNAWKCRWKMEFP